MNSSKTEKPDPCAKVRRALTLALLLAVIMTMASDLYFPFSFNRGGEGGAAAPKQSAATRAANAALRAEQVKTHGVNLKGDKVMVIARYKEDSSWVDTYFMDFPHVVITPGLPGATYTTPKNKGNEVGPFLWYILDNYDRLPAHMAFIHGHRVSHHTYNLDIVPAMKAVRWGAMPYLPLNVHMFQRVDSEKPEYEDIRRVWPRLFKDIAPEMPKEILSWCCAQFVVTRAAVRARPKAFYQAIYDWVTDADPVLGNATSFISSRVLEQTWHMIFGMPAAADILPVCDVYHCDILDTVTEQVEKWEGTPFDRIPCKVYDIKHIQDWRTRLSPTQRPEAEAHPKVLARAPSEEEAARMLMETQARAEAAEAFLEEDRGRRESGELREALKLENTEVAKYHTGFGRPEEPALAVDSEEEKARKVKRGARLD